MLYPLVPHANLKRGNSTSPPKFPETLHDSLYQLDSSNSLQSAPIPLNEGDLPARTNCPTAALNPAKKELNGYPPVKHAYTNCTAPTYIKNTRNASMIRSELGVFALYDFHRSVLAVESRERERDVEEDVDWEARMGGREGVDVIVESEVVCRCFLGVFGGIFTMESATTRE
jgi:hypothetical protein